jgi:hypothetical protein
MFRKQKQERPRGAFLVLKPDSTYLVASIKKKPPVE